MPNSLDYSKTLHLVDPELRAVLEVFSGFDLRDDTLESLRGLPTSEPLKSPPYQEQYVPRANGEEPLRLLVITPQKTSKPANLNPAMVYMHGGGFVMGSPEMILLSVQKLARDTGRIIVIPQYRLAPEHPFPAALDDNILALKWTHQNAKNLHIDTFDIAIGGDSAGGGHAAILAAAIRGMDKLPVSRLLLIYPMLDDRTGAKALRENITGEFIWTAENNRFGWASYLGKETDLTNGCVPARLKNLEGFPPTFIATCGLDLFMEENIRFIERLQEAGITADIYMAEGAYHGFNVLVPEAQVSKNFHSACVAALNKPL